MYPDSAFPSQALGNIWTIGREQVSGLQLHYFSSKDNQGENFWEEKKGFCYLAAVQEMISQLAFRLLDQSSNV